MSIKRQLTLLTISVVVLATFFAALHGYRNSLKQLDNIFDQELHTVASLLMNLVDSGSTIPITFDGEIGFQVFQKGEMTHTSTNATSRPVSNTAEGFSIQNHQGKRWRVFVIEQSDVKVVTMQPLNLRAASAESILLVTITPLVVVIPIIALLIYYIINRSLSGLTSLSTQLKRKTADDLTTITLIDTPDELAPVLSRLNNLFVRLEQAFERERQLTANAAHELRTPVSVLTLTAHNMQQDFENEQLTSAAFSELKQNIQRMAHVIEQMIALYRFTPEQFAREKQPVELQRVLQDVISNNFTDLDNHQQTIELNASEATVLGEPFALNTLFENILRNSIKYSGNATQIKVSVERDNDVTTVVIEDSGKGIEDAQLDKIFERFYRVEATQKREKGSGLGLSIAWHIMALHHGKIWCSRSSLGGLKTTMQFPHVPAESETKLHQPPPLEGES
ncbi:sensor histidine kinase [Alteromonas facilis]|uniref:sensor histidine kinase n=1 Tax=Alteromonas facilis TaxID=2048004 RepID=UPI000C2907CE|nr:HAMP domain-containing sensor histidine kinase [Alteromonas facilis]